MGVPPTMPGWFGVRFPSPAPVSHRGLDAALAPPHDTVELVIRGSLHASGAGGPDPADVMTRYIEEGDGA